MAAFAPAKRGDLVLVVEDRREFIIGQEAQEYVAAVVGIVASIDRLGHVKRYASTWGSVCAMPARARALVVSKADIDVTAAFDAAKAHTYPGHPTQPQPFASIDEAREFLRPFRKASACQ